MKPIGIVVV